MQPPNRNKRLKSWALGLSALAAVGGGLLALVDQRIAYRVTPLEAKMDERFGLVDHRLDSLEGRIDRMEERFDDRFERLEGRFERLEGRFDQFLAAYLAEGNEADKAKAALRANLRERRRDRLPQGERIKLGDGKAQGGKDEKVGAAAGTGPQERRQGEQPRGSGTTPGAGKAANTTLE